MTDLLQSLFGAVCGQNPGHTWCPGGVMLPCCQRCTGLYAGAAVAALMHTWVRPPLTARFLEAHALFLLIMVPLGFHWIPQGPALRVISGVLFGAALFTYCWLPFQKASPKPRSASLSYSCYGAGLAICTIGIMFGSGCGKVAWTVLTTFVTAGAACLYFVAIASVCAAAFGIIKSRRLTFHASRITRYFSRTGNT